MGGDSRGFPRCRKGLHVAASFGLKSIVWLLVDQGANLAAKDDWGRTVLHIAAENGFADIVQMFPDYKTNGRIFHAARVGNA
jgi:ankyrin repeat protein